MSHSVDKAKKGKAELEGELESALKATFPASDAVALENSTSDKPDRPVGRRPPKIDKELVDKLAREVAAKKGDAA